MGSDLTLSVTYRNQEYNFPAELRVFGYTHKIAVTVNDTIVLFEPDEERNYRAVIADSEKNKKTIDPELLQAIAEELETALK
jgi:hypothetical protein